MSDSLRTLLAQLEVVPPDVEEVLRTMPSPEQLEKSQDTLAHGNVPKLPESMPLFAVHLILVSVDAMRRRDRELEIPDDISWETLSFLGRAMTAYRASHGETGIQITRWDWLRFTGSLYQVGRLEVTPYRLRAHPQAGPLFWYDDEEAERLGPGFRKGDPALGIHVPAADPLTPQACDESLHRMRTAFTGLYPGEPLQVATCTSWLLDEQLAEYLPADSNILDFQRRFQLVPGARDNDEAILHFVFGAGHPQQLDALPQRTTLERAVVAHLRRGRHWRMRTGWFGLTPTVA